MKKTHGYLLAFMAIASLSACGPAKSKPEVQPKTIAGIVTDKAAADQPEFKTLLTAVKAAGLLDTLNGTNDLTVFAPTDAAFKKISKEKLDDLLKPENKEKLQSILKYHIISKKVPSEEVLKLNGKSVKTLQGSEIAISVKDKNIFLNKDTKVTPVDIMAKNGVIHVVDTVLMPPENKPK